MHLLAPAAATLLPPLLLPLLLLLLLSTAHHALAHGSHPSHDAEGDLTWSERHMQEEHHIYNFDSGAFFHLHDFDNSGAWTRDEVLRFYGLEQPDSSASEDTKQHVWQTVADLVTGGDGRRAEITMAQFQAFVHAGNTLPDFGLGPGHHGDPEYEYEIHHFEKYHNEDSTEEELNHPEDIEHFRIHDEEEDAEFAQAILEQSPIIEKNIPNKFRPRG